MKFKISRRTFMTATAAIGGTLAMPGILRAQSFASKPVFIIVPNGAGGSNDTLARLIAPTLEKQFGQPVVVENRPGAGTNIGFSAILNAPADGHMIFVSSAAILSARHTLENSPGDPVTDLEHITIIADGAFRGVINASNGIKSYEELVAHLKANPGSLRHSTPGFANNIHLLTEIFKARAGIEMPAVHYNSVGNVLADLLANEVQVGVMGPHLTNPYIEEGRLVPLFTTGRQRETDYPDIPTTLELGLADVDKFRNWFGMHVKKGTPADIVTQIYDATKLALADETVQKTIIANKFDVGGITPEEYTKTIVEENAVYAEAAELIKL